MFHIEHQHQILFVKCPTSRHFTLRDECNITQGGREGGREKWWHGWSSVLFMHLIGTSNWTQVVINSHFVIFWLKIFWACQSIDLKQAYYLNALSTFGWKTLCNCLHTFSEMGNTFYAMHSLFFALKFWLKFAFLESSLAGFLFDRSMQG